VTQLAPAPVLRTAFRGIVDYAGLFPPASRSMSEAVARYAGHRQSAARWMLGRFVVGAARLRELHDARGTAPSVADRWPLTVTLGADVVDGLERLADFSGRAGDESFTVASLEVKVATPDDVTRLAARLPTGVEWYFEVPIAGPYAPFAAAIAEVGGRAKVRTGGVTPELFPSAGAVIELVAEAAAAAIPFKATAGLHHAIRGNFPLTYAAGAPQHTMYGFINLLLATALVRRDGDRAAARTVLLDSDPASFRIGEDGVFWRGRRFDDDELGATRRAAFTSFGSCSFREPVDGLAGVAR